MLIAETKHVESALDIFLEVEVTDAFQEGSEEFVALSHSTAQALVVGIEVVEESLHVILARSSDGTVLDGTEVIAERGVQLSIVLGGIRHVDKELRREDKETFCIDDLRASILCHLIGHVNVVGVLHTSLTHQLVAIVGDVF